MRKAFYNLTRHCLLPALLITFMLGAVLTPLALEYTWADRSERPDATVTYTENRLTWDIAADDKGVADLGLFGDPEQEGDLPLIHPYSAGDYCLRVKNSVVGPIAYRVFLYADNPHQIPLQFDVTMSEDMEVITEDFPPQLEGKQVLQAVRGIVNGRQLKDLELHWFWDSPSDPEDTQMGNKTAAEEQVYTIHTLVVIEDNNSYYVPGLPSNGPDLTLYRDPFVVGAPDGSFHPEEAITRAETAAIFARLLLDFDEDAIYDGKNPFRDVDTNAWYAKYIAAVKEADLMGGYPNGSFGPTQPITRAEFASLALRWYRMSGGKITGLTISFSDVGLFHWARADIRDAEALGLIKGYPDGTFRPDDPIARAEAVVIVCRLLCRLPDQEGIDRYLAQTGEYFNDVTDPNYWAYYEIYDAALGGYVLPESGEDQ